MQRPRNLVPQEVPPGFAEKLREMRDAHDPRLNAVLARARSMGWRTATLAETIGSKPAACSKRIERAEPAAPETIARAALRAASLRMREADMTAAGLRLEDWANTLNPQDYLERAGTMLDQMADGDPPLVACLREIRRAEAYVPPAKFDISEINIPEPHRVQAMMNGQRLDRKELATLRSMQSVASRVNGALPSDHEFRKVSEDYTQKLNHLITKRGFTPYYLAKELGVTHRAITSRLERHGYRQPCPSVVGTPSGVYRGRKIGETVTAEPA